MKPQPMESFEFVVRLTEDVLGTVPMNKDVYETHVQAKD